MRAVGQLWRRNAFAGSWLRVEQWVLERLQRRSRGPEQARHLQTGLRGEQEALFYLRRLGYTVVAQRWSAGYVRGDLDLVAWDGDVLVVFEVKARTARDFAPAEAAVDHAKQKQLRLVARAYLRQMPREFRERVALRFDVLSVYLLPGGVEFAHFRNAF